MHIILEFVFSVFAKFDNEQFTVFRSSFQLCVGTRGIRAVTNDGLCSDLSTHAKDLEDFILSQV